MKNIPVTGGAGFIGSQLIDEPPSMNNEVVCFDNFDTFYDPLIKRGNIRLALDDKNYTLVERDIRNSLALQRCFNGKKLDVVIHLTARAGVPVTVICRKGIHDSAGSIKFPSSGMFEGMRYVFIPLTQNTGILTLLKEIFPKSLD